MQIAMTFRHMDSSDSLKDYMEQKLERVRKFLPDPVRGHVVFSVDRGYDHLVDIQLHLHHGILIKCQESSDNMYSSIDLVVDKIERQVKRYKEKLQNHKPSTGPQRIFRHHIVEVSENDMISSVDLPTITKEERYVAEPMTVEEAVMRLNLSHDQILCFNNANTQAVNVIYLRKDGTYGLIETNQE